MIIKRFRLPDIDQRTACNNDGLRKVVAANPRARLVDFGSFICPPGKPCLDTYAGQPLRPDGAHFRAAAAKFAVRWLVPRVMAAAKQTR